MSEIETDFSGVRFIAIAAMAENRVIGRGNKLPWHVPEDFHWFKSKTVGKTLLMGRKTFQSLGKPLPKRRTIVLSRSGISADGVTVVASLNELEAELTEPELWICGGAEIYRMTMDRWDELFLSVIDGEYEGDAFFPELGNRMTGGEIVHEGAGFRVRHYLGHGR
jgi:dihydrofolate reductase